MDFAFTAEDEAFRAELRGFLREHWTGQPRDRGSVESFQQTMAARGWLTMSWPKAYGGGGATHMQQLIFKEEIFNAGAPGSDGGVNLVGPALMVHGTEEQKREHLPRIARAEVKWCQGFSEPGAGSDLASLQTRAVRDGDDYVINGQKIWTSGAHEADWIHVLTRTDPDAPKHRGISYFLADMKSPGITVRPITQITGRPGFNETYFDNVRVPARNMVGELNRGWYAATTTLDFERSGIERNFTARGDWNRAYTFLQTDAGRAALKKQASGWRQKLIELRIECEAGMWIARRVAWMQGRGLVPNYESSMSKVFNSEVGQRVSEFVVNLFGLTGLLREGDRHAVLEGMPAFRYLDARRLSVGQGTSEINRNVIATRGLGLPRG